jgi:hypothetical protein
MKEVDIKTALEALSPKWTKIKSAYPKIGSKVKSSIKVLIEFL